MCVGKGNGIISVSPLSEFQLPSLIVICGLTFTSRNFCHFPVGHRTFIECLCAADSDRQFRRCLTHESVRREHVAHNFPIADLNHYTRSYCFAITHFSYQFQSHAVGSFGKSIQEKSERAATNRANEQVRRPVLIKIGGHDRT